MGKTDGVKPTPAIPWSDRDLFVMMCTLNFRIEDIRSAMKKDKKAGITFASQLLSEAVGNGCTPTRVERKIKHLWSNWGIPDGDREPHELYTYGVFHKTLPGADPGFLTEVAARVWEMQR